VLRVAVIDGHPVTRVGLNTLLDKEEDVRVVGEAGSGEEALRLVAKAQPDLVVLGLNLARELDGIEVCRRIKAMPDAPYVLVFTAYDFPKDMSSGFLAGADSYLHKRNGTEALLRAMRRTASGEKVWDVGEGIGEPRSVVSTTPTGASLTSREIEVLGLKLRRYTNAEIAEALGISPDTVKHHITNIYRKLGRKRKDLLFS
jgi:two-component system, NarL family, response regulator DevR